MGIVWQKIGVKSRGRFIGNFGILIKFLFYAKELWINYFFE